MRWGKYRKVQNFSVPIEKEVMQIDNYGKESVVTISFKIKYFDTQIEFTKIIQKLFKKN